MEGLASQTHRWVTEALSHTGRDDLVVGVGDPQDGLAHAIVSYRQALNAARTAGIIRTFGPVVVWSRLGIYRLLSQIPPQDMTTDIIHPGLTRLFEAPGSTMLVETLERYLDLGGDVKATASALSLHRASLYYRLGRIEHLVGASLRDGEERLALHLGLKLARMVDLRPRERRKAERTRREV